MAKIFISYRRVDRNSVLDDLHQRMVAAFGDADVFYDVESLRPGDPFPDRIRTEIARSRVLIAIIGSQWNVTLEEHRERSRDFVRLEIETAFQQKVRVIPVVLPGAGMPTRDQLPASIASIADCHAYSIRPNLADEDIRALIRHLKIDLGSIDWDTGERTLAESWAWFAIAGITATVAIVLGTRFCAR